MMEIVIKIPEDVYTRLFDNGIQDNEIAVDDVCEMARALRLGKPLPKHHGRLIDADRTLTIAWQNFYKHEDEWEKKDEDYLPIHRFYDQLGFECCQQTIVNAPTIIEGSDSE